MPWSHWQRDPRYFALARKLLLLKYITAYLIRPRRTQQDEEIYWLYGSSQWHHLEPQLNATDTTDFFLSEKHRARSVWHSQQCITTASELPHAKNSSTAEPNARIWVLLHYAYAVCTAILALCQMHGSELSQSPPLEAKNYTYVPKSPCRSCNI